MTHSWWVAGVCCSYDWSGCYPQQVARMYRPPQMTEDFGVPLDEACHETGDNTGVFSRRWSKATVSWDCNVPGAKGGQIDRLPSSPVPALRSRSRSDRVGWFAGEPVPRTPAG